MPDENATPPNPQSDSDALRESRCLKILHDLNEKYLNLKSNSNQQFISDRAPISTARLTPWITVEKQKVAELIPALLDVEFEHVNGEPTAQVVQEIKARLEKEVIGIFDSLDSALRDELKVRGFGVDTFGQAVPLHKAEALADLDTQIETRLFQRGKTKPSDNSALTFIGEAEVIRPIPELPEHLLREIVRFDEYYNEWNCETTPPQLMAELRSALTPFPDPANSDAVACYVVRVCSAIISAHSSLLVGTVVTGVGDSDLLTSIASLWTWFMKTPSQSLVEAHRFIKLAEDNSYIKRHAKPPNAWSEYRLTPVGVAIWLSGPMSKPAPHIGPDNLDKSDKTESKEMYAQALADGGVRLTLGEEFYDCRNRGGELLRNAVQKPGGILWVLLDRTVKGDRSADALKKNAEYALQDAPKKIREKFSITLTGIEIHIPILYKPLSS